MLFYPYLITLVKDMELEEVIGTQLDPDRVDLPPEYCHYRDEGCDLADSCLSCPFPRCIYDEPWGRQRLLKGRRNREIVRLFRKGGKGVRELAKLFGVSQRTVQRTLKNYRVTHKEESQIF